MKPSELHLTAITHVVYAAMRQLLPGVFVDNDERDRGAVSIEQVLWYAAAAISVTVVSIIIWQRIKEQAETPVNAPTAP
jgi:hypothetical protein